MNCRILIAPLMAEDGKPTVGDYALKGEGFPVLVDDVTESGRFSVNYVGTNGRGGGASCWWDACDFTILKSPTDVLRCNVHHAYKMGHRADAEVKKYKKAEATFEAALEAMHAMDLDRG